MESPRKKLAAKKRKCPAVKLHHCAVGEAEHLIQLHCSGFSCRCASFRIKNCVNLPSFPDVAESCGKCLRPLASAVEAWTMASGQRGHFSQKEKLRPPRPAAGAVSSHDIAFAATKIAYADDPGLVCPTPPEQRFRIGIVDDAAIPGEHATGIRSQDLAEGVHTILQGQNTKPLTKTVASARQLTGKSVRQFNAA